jgi:hypothetical protein
MQAATKIFVFIKKITFFAIYIGVLYLRREFSEIILLIRAMSALMMEAASTSETSVNYQTTRRDNSEDSHLHTHRHENLKSHRVP